MLGPCGLRLRENSGVVPVGGRLTGSGAIRDVDMDRLNRFLARFTIRTKVLILVVPFVVSILAIAATGMVASSALQQRMALSYNFV